MLWLTKKSVLETFSYIIANKPTLWFADGLSKKLTNYQPPYSFCSKTNWNLKLSECILAPQVASILVSTCCLTHVLVELRVPSFPPSSRDILLVWVIQCDEAEVRQGAELSCQITLHGGWYSPRAITFGRSIYSGQGVITPALPLGQNTACLWQYSCQGLPKIPRSGDNSKVLHFTMTFISSICLLP